MRYFSWFLTILLLAGCSSGKTGSVSTGTNEVVAVVDGIKITDQELTIAAKDQLHKIEGQIYQVKRSVLDNLVEQKMLELAAKKAGVSVDDYLKNEVDAKITEPSEAELKEMYETRKTKDTPAFDVVKPQIAAYIKRTRQAQAEQDMYEKIRKDSNVTIKLEPPRVKIDISGQPSMGPETAPVTLVEVSDYQCPFCKRIQPTLDRVMQTYQGKIRRVFLDFPLSFHADSPKAHEAAHCAGEQDKYFEMYHHIFGNQTNIKVSDLKKYAQEISLDMGKFEQCLDSGKYTAQVQKNTSIGVAAGVSGTPAFFINGVMLSGAQPFSSFQEIIDNELAAQK